MYGNGYFSPVSSFGIPMTRGLGIGASRGLGAGLLSRGGILRGINWGGLLNGASKTLGVVNQAVPLVRQVGPMFNNMKSMLKIASVFKDETDTPKTSDNLIKDNNNKRKEENITYKTNNTPNFFI